MRRVCRVGEKLLRNSSVVLRSADEHDRSQQNEISFISPGIVNSECFTLQ